MSFALPARRAASTDGQCSTGELQAIIKGVRKQVLMQVLHGTADSNIRFDDLRSLLAALGFSERVRGSHHIFARPGVAEILNVQPRGSFAKAYQV